MVEEEETAATWFSPIEQQRQQHHRLPSPEELTPLYQTLITPDLALAFDIHSPTAPRTPPPPPPPPSDHSSADYDSGDLCSGSGSGTGAGTDEPARTLKRPRLVWTPQLHKRFVEAVAHLGIKNAVPKTIMQLMNVDGLTRENVASHLQKYRLYLKRMQGLPPGSGPGPGSGHAFAGNICHGSVDAATDHLFASSPVPPHFLHSNSDHFLPLISVVQQRQQQQQQQYQMENQRVYRVGASGGHNHHGYSEDMEMEGCSGGGRRVLTLFPSGDD